MEHQTSSLPPQPPSSLSLLGLLVPPPSHVHLLPYCHYRQNHDLIITIAITIIIITDLVDGLRLGLLERERDCTPEKVILWSGG